jgi:twitching motility two-component system response regulator PilH
MSKVLIVDDSPTQLHSLCAIVKSGGHQTVTADSGERAIELASDESPSVILMDIVMPGMSGFQATRKLASQESTSDIPVIFVTSKSEESDRIWGMRQGAKDFLTKPVEASTLLSAIEEAMAA